MSNSGPFSARPDAGIRVCASVWERVVARLLVLVVLAAGVVVGPAGSPGGSAFGRWVGSLFAPAEAAAAEPDAFDGSWDDGVVAKAAGWSAVPGPAEVEDQTLVLQAPSGTNGASWQTSCVTGFTEVLGGSGPVSAGQSLAIDCPAGSTLAVMRMFFGTTPTDEGLLYEWESWAVREYGRAAFGLSLSQATGADQLGTGTMADPVNTATGDLVEHDVDLSIPDLRADVSISRTYNSGDTREGVLGKGWRAGFEFTAVPDPVTGAVTVAFPSGRQVTYASDGVGGYTAPPGAVERLTQVSGELRLADANQEVRFDAAGRVASIVATDTGDLVSYTYTAGRVSRISGPTRHIDLAYIAAGRLETATADDGRVVTYGYTDGALTSVTSPGGKTVRYGYDQDRATSPYAQQVLADTPAAYWRLGEASGTVARDDIGVHNGTHASTLLGAPGAVHADADTATTFDGGDAVVVADHPALSGTADLSLEAWVKVDVTSTTYQPIMSRGQAGTYEIAADMRTGAAQRSLAWRSSDTPATFANFFDASLDGQWVHVVVTVTGLTATAYRNGALFGTASIAARSATTTALTIGRRTTSGSSSFKGGLDEVALYSSALSPARVMAHYRTGRPYAGEVTADQAISHWRLGETNGTTASDFAGTADGTYTGVTLGAAGALVRDDDTSAGFDGVDDRVIVANNTAFPTTGEATFEAWVRPDTTAKAYQPIMSKGSAGPFELAADFRIGATERSLQWRSGSGGLTPNFPGFFDASLDGQWVHVAVTVSGTTATAYRNGDPFGAPVTIGARVSNTNDVALGKRAGSSSFWFDGDIDDVAIYGSKLPASRIKAHYVSGQPYVAAVLADAPTAYWRLGETSGSKATDQRGTHHADYTDVGLGAAGAVTGDPNTAATFDGVNDIADATDHLALAGAGDLTLEAWVKPSATTGQLQTIMSKGSSGPFEIAADMRPGATFRALAWRSNGVSKNFAGFFDAALDGSWTHVVVAVSGTTATAYRNGTLFGTVTIDSRPATTNKVALGNRPNVANVLSGALDEVAIYPSKLTAVKARAHYEAGRPSAPHVPAIDGRLTSATAPDGSLIHKTFYDGLGRVVAQRDANGGKTTFDYAVDGAWNGTVTMTDPAGGVWVDTYDERVLVARKTADGVLTQYAYDADGQLVAQRDPFGPAVFTYNADGRLTKTHNRDGVATTTYTADGRVDVETSKLGRQSDSDYDSAGHLVKVTAPDAGETTYTYTGDDLVETVTDAEGGVTTFEYNAAGQVTKTTGPTGLIETRTYWPQGWLKAVTGPTGTMSYAYDLDGRVETVKNPLDEVTTSHYDAFGRLEDVTDHAGRFTGYTYDSAGRVKTSTDHAGRSMSYAYDITGRIKSQTDVANHTAAFTYDLAGRVETATDPQGAVGYDYNAMGQPLLATRTDNSTVAYTYDTRGRITKVDAGGQPTLFTYDKYGRVKTQRRGNSELIYDYDPATGLISSLAQHDYDQNTTDQVAYYYDKLGRVKTLGWTPSSGASEVFQYEYFADGQIKTIKSITRGWATLADYTYDTAGRLKTVTAADGTVERYTYDGLSRPATRRVTNAADTVTLDEESITYDSRGNPIKVVRTAATTSYAYDNADQLIRVCSGATTCPETAATETYTYDTLGNRLTRTTAAGTDLYAYNQTLNQLTQVTPASGPVVNYTYDARGRTKTVGPLTLSYDTASDQLTGATHTDGRSWTYQYDVTGIRTKSTTTASGTTTSTHHSTDPMSGELMATSTGTTTQRLLPMGLGRVDGSDLVFNHTDRVGSASSVTGTVSGAPAVKHAYDYSAFGALSPGSTPDPATDLRFGGHPDGPPGLTLMAGRPYETATGRFLTVDPMGAQYKYAENSPILYSDPSGQSSCVDSWGAANGCLTVVSSSANKVGFVALGAGLLLAPFTGGASLVVAVGYANAAFAVGAVATAAQLPGRCIGNKGGCAGAVLMTAVDVVLSVAHVPAGWHTAASRAPVALRAAGNAAGEGAEGMATSTARASTPAPPSLAGDLAGAACSFGAATTVVMADGTRKPISEIEVDDYVLAEDPETGERGPRRVTHVWEHDDTVVDLAIDGDVVTTTEDHPFWNASDLEWQQARDLDIGDLLRTADGELVHLGGIRLRTARTTTAFNLTVDGIHTYFVGAGEDDVLVHNTCGIPANGSRMSVDDALTRGEDWLGKGYTEPVPGTGRYVSADGRRVFRMRKSDITGAHGGGRHVNFEELVLNPARPGRLKVGPNSHVYLTDW